MVDEALNFSGVIPVRPRHAIDLTRLAEYLADKIEDFPASPEGISLFEFKGGQSNPTYRIQVGNRAWVLRRKPPGKLLASAHAVEREFQVISALQESDVPVPRTLCLCEDPEVIGTTFFVMECVDGRILWDPTLPHSSPTERAAMFAELNRVIAALHKVDFDAVDLSGFGKKGNYFARQIDRWTRQYRASETEPIGSMDRLIEWLPAHIPEAEETTIVHGDYRLDNVVFHPTEPRILAVLDWELSTLGHPLADFAYHCMTWHIPAGPFRGLLGADLRNLGIPTEADYVHAYCRRTGREVDPDQWDFCMAYNLFRLAAILQGIMGRIKEGTAASAYALAMAKAAAPLADLGWKQVERMARANRTDRPS